MVFLIVGGVNLGLKAFTGQDVLVYLTGKGTFVTNLIFFFIGVSALCLAFYRDSYLPFLGPTIVPCSVLTAKTPEGADFDVRVHVKPGAKVLYWAAESATKDLQDTHDWRKAYLSFKNAGVAIADSDGNTTLRVRKPQPYTVLVNKELSPHIHYRVCEDEGLMGRVQTVTLDGKEYFENVSAQEIQETHEPQEIQETQGKRVESASVGADMAEVNRIAENTTKHNLMVQTGAFDESSTPKGALLEQAF